MLILNDFVSFKDLVEAGLDRIHELELHVSVCVCVHVHRNMIPINAKL